MLKSSMKSPVWENESTTRIKQKVNHKNILRWYGTPCNIYKDERILNYDYNHGFKKI